MEADVLNALKSQTAYLSGGLDLDSNLIIIFQLPCELQPWTKRYIEVSIKYLLESLSEQSLSNGLVAIVDAQKCSWRMARDQIKLITQQLDKNLNKVYALRSDAFSVQNCAKSYKKGEPIVISKSRLNKFFNLSELPIEIGGLQHYNHDEWIRNRIQIDEFKKFFDSTVSSIKTLKENLSNINTMRSSEIEQTMKMCNTKYLDIQKHIKFLLENGNKLISHIVDCQSKEAFLSQDILDAKETIKNKLNEIESEQTAVTVSWTELEKSLSDAKELMQLEEGVSYVTNWILSTAESLLNGQLKVGYDVQSAEKLRLDHEILEFQCWKTYGYYGELLYKIDNFPGNKESFAFKDLLSQRDFMDFVCRSFATRLERRRNLLITSVRFYRLVAEYFQRTSSVFESLLQTQNENMDNFELAKVKLQKIKDSQVSLGNIEKELVKEGEKLSDILSMPIKDALGRDIEVDYSEDIANLREVLDAAKARFKIFSDSLDIQKLTLEQITNIHACEKDAETAIKWVESLYKVMLKSHTHVGCNVSEIQNQKDEHQAFQETAKSTFNYGIQLLNAAFALRQSCKLNSDKNLGTIDHLKKTWKNLHAVSQEQMTRLRVSAVFYRSVDEHCGKLEQLKASVLKLKDIEERERKIVKLRKYLAVRERLLVEVGRMVRLGRLLRTRLKEPFVMNNDLESMSSEENIIAMPADNSIATDSISAKLIEVSRVAESLDAIIHETQDALNIFENNGSTAVTMPVASTSSVDGKTSSANTSDDWNNSLKSSTEDESFVTASEYATSRSSSYHTASECRDHSPWWTDTAERSSVDLDSSDPEQPNIKELTITSSSGNGSFDNSETSFRSPIPSSLFNDQNDSSDSAIKLKNDNESESSSSPSLPPKISSPHEEYTLPPILSSADKKIYTIFESPTSTPSQDDERIENESPKSGDSLHIKVTEIIPKFTFLGRNLDEALNLQKQHEDLLLNIQNLPTPLEEFYRKIQEKIASNEPQNPRLIEDMAESLSQVWSDILKILHERRTIISLNVLFFERLGECYGKMSSLECACRDTMIPIEVDSVREFLEKFKHLRVDVLASIVNPLTVGNQLLEKLKDITSVGSLDSRPDHILDESKKSVTQVELWLEDLSDKRNNLETAWLNRKIQLEQCLILAQLSKDLTELEKILNKQRDEILGTFTLGDSTKSAESLLQDYNAWKVDALALRDKSLKITKTTEEVVKQGNFTGEEACAKAYQVLAGCTEYLDEIDLRETLLLQSKEFFSRAENVMKKFDELEVDLKRVSLRPGSPNFIPVHLKLMQEVSSAINNVLELGYSLIDEVGRTKPEVLGVKHVVDEIERRKIYLEAAFSKASEKHIKISDELNIFLEQYNDIFSWIETQKRERIINGPLNFMGNNVAQAKDCLNSHQQLLRQLEIKNEEFKNVKSKFQPFMESLEDSQRDDVNEKIKLLSINWNDLNNFVSARIPIIELYLRFHQEAEHLINLFNNLEQTLKTTRNVEEFHYIDTVWSKIQTQFSMLKNIAKLFNTEKIKVAEPYLQVDRAANCIEKTLDAFSSRQLEISGIWENFNTTKEINIILEKIMAENVETISLTAKIEDELYPILATSEELPRDLIRFVDNKLKSVQNEIQQSEVELSQRIEKIDKLEVKDQASCEKIVQVKNNLNSIKTKLFSISADYNELVDIVLSFLRSYQEIYESIREYFSEKDQFAAPVGGENVANLIRDYETFKNNTMESFRSLLAQSEKLIDRIKMQEPPGAKEHDTDKIITLLENLRTYFESNAASENSELKRQFFITEFEKLLKDLNENISDLQLQFNDMNDKFGDSAAACKVSSLSYEYYERNVDLLNKRIENFINSYSNNISYPDAKPYVSDELMKLLKRWDDFKNQSAKLKSNLSLAQQYFSLLENVETRYHKTYTFLVNSVNLRKDELKTSAAAFDLIDELEKYVVDNKQAQLDDLKKLSQISQNVFGYDKTENLYADNIFIFQSFEKMKSDIVDLVKDLKRKEDPVAMINEIDNKILVIESHEEVLRNETIHEIVPVIENEPPKFLRYLESAEVTEGDSFIFECILTGNPEPTIQWLKYNSPLAVSSNYKISFVNGKCRLEIPKITNADAAVFSCIATNVAGTSQTTANLIVKPRQEVQPMTPPSFLRLLQNAYANERSTFEFNCLVDGNPLPTVQWYRNDMCVDNDINYNITYNNGNAILKIPTVRVEDQGIFTVKAINQLGYNECSAILSVEAVEKSIKPTIKSPLSNLLTKTGQKITLECNIAGKPQPEVYVMHNGKILSDHDVNLQYDGETVRLTLPQTASVKDSGIYKVIGRNIAGEASTECFVQVEQQQEEVQAPTQPKLIKPSIQQPLKDISVFEGKPIQLESIIVGQPEPEVIWLQNDKPVKESNDIRLYFQGDTCTLFINEAFLEDAGVYKIIALNSAGEASSECRVSVTPLNILEPAIRPPESERFLSSSVMPPKFEKLLTDGLANEGETVELECCLVSGPLPEIKWYLNNKEIVYNDRIQAVANEDGALKLIIRNVLPDDKGVYTVKATNSTGIAKCFSHLIVKSTANSSGDNLLNRMEADHEKIICPTFRELFADRSVNYGDSTKFECIVYGKPTPKIKWYFNDMPVHGRDFLISTSGDRQVLTIPKVTPESVGKISCIAENEAGKATCVAMLSGSGIPLSSEEQFTTQEDISGSSFITMQKHITTTTTTKQSNVFGNGIPPQSQFHSTSEQIDSSYKKVGDAPAEVSESKKYEEVRESSAEPQQTFAQKLLNFSRNDMTNEKHESIIAQSGQISTGKPIRRSTAPRFVSPLIGKIVDQGVDVVLEGIVDGYPSPNVEVTKNDEPISSIPGAIEISYSLNKIVIKLFNVSTKDAGRYSAIAKNDAGSATSTADVVVKKSIFPPVFGRRLQAQVVKKGERVIMDCEITGTPEPQVSWYKDDKPIAQAMANEYRITQLGICHKLIIDAVKVQDTGKYMVKAVNSGGEAQSIADFMVLESQPDRMVEVTKTVVFSDLPSNQLKTDPLLDQSIPKENGISKENYSAHQELSSKAQLGSSTESKVIMETTRTTSATMRLEHKPQFNDLPPITFSQRTQTPTIPLVSEGTMIDSELSVSKHSEQTQTDAPKPKEFEIPIRQELPKEPERPKDVPFPFVETPKIIQTPEPIRKSALEFFENNLKNLPELNQDRYTRYEDAVKGSHTYVSKQQEIKEQFHTKLNDDLSYFNLKPEPPAELSFMPKTQPIAPPEKIIEKVKKLEEVHQTSETPLSGTIHPPMYKKEEKFEKKEFISTKSTTPFVPKVPTPTFAPHVHQLIPDTRVGRSPSPKPSTEGVNMEKLWAMKPKTPEPFIVPQPQPQQQIQSQEDYKSFTQEHKSSFVAYSSQKTFKQESVEPPKEHFVPIQPYQAPQEPAPVEELPKTSIKDTKSFFEQRIKEEEVKSISTELKAPSLVKQFAKPMVPLVPDNYELGIEPGAPPEICYAPKPVLERKQSYVEKIEKSLEQNIEKEPDRVPRGGVRIFPQRQTPNRMSSQSPQRFQSPKPIVQQQLPKPAPQPVYHPPEPVFKAPEPVFKASEPEPIIKPVEAVFKAPEPILQPEPQPIFMTQPIQPPKGPEPFIPEKFESTETRSTEFKKEETISGYRRVAPPKFIERGKSSEPTFVPPPKFESPTFTKAPEPITREIPIQKQEPIIRDVPIQKYEPIKQQPAPQPTYQNYQQQTKQQSFLYKSEPVKQPAPQPVAPMPLIQPGPQPIYQNYQSSSHQEQTFIKKTETIKQSSGPQPSPQTIHQPQQQSVPQPKQIIKPSAVKPKGKFEDFVSETQQSFQSMYKNFVKSEQNQHTTESYFQRIASPKTITQSSQQQQTPTQSQFKKPEQSQDTNSTQIMKNISMTSKQIKINEEPITIQPVTQTSTSHYSSSHKSEQSYESESKYQQTWRPSSEHCYKPVTPNLPQTPQNFTSHMMQSPPAPSAFETPLQYTGTARPKFEPIDKPIPIQHVKKVEQKQPKVFKPTPVTPGRSAYSNHLENSSQQSNQSKSYYYTTSAPQTTSTTYYTAVAGQPVHNAIAHETSNTMHMKESTEQSHRVVNITQTRRVITLDGSKKEEEKLEPFPFSPQPDTYHHKPRVPPPPTPTKFIRGEFRESDYDSDFENVRIRPIWTPSQQHAHDNLQYRPVRPPSSRSSSVPPSTRSYDRVKTPMEFDTGPVIMPTRIKIESPSLKTPQQYFSSALYRDQIKEKKIPIVTRDDIGIQKSSFTDHASNMNAAFKTKAHQFMKDVMVEQQQQQQKQQKPILKKAGSVGAGDGQGSQAYREESRVSQYGTKHVDPDTGIIYFKYDFGYEFGVIFQDGKKVVGGIRNNQNESKRVLPERTSDIEVPVLHEKTGRASVVSFGATTPIEFERLDKAKKRYSLPTPSSNDRFTPKNGTIQASEYSTNIVYDRSGSNTPFDIVNQQKQGAPKNPPMFITPLKDIAVVAGQTARFECIVQCDPHTVYWMKNGQMLENSFKYQIEYRNGVCRCTIPQACKDDAGTYECVAQNNVGTDTTAAMLIIPGDKRGFRIY